MPDPHSDARLIIDIIGMRRNELHALVHHLARDEQISPYTPAGHARRRLSDALRRAGGPTHV